MLRRTAAFVSVLALWGALPAQAQEAPLAVSVDCPGYVPGCDVGFFQTEIPFAKFVRDQSAADVAVLITAQSTGGGGRRYDLVFRGQRAAAGRGDTLTVRTLAGATDDGQRRALLGRLALGVAGFTARTGLADRISIAYVKPTPTEVLDAAPVQDPWNGWVFRLNSNARFDGEQRKSSFNTSGSFRASRVTERWKVTVQPNVSYKRDAYTLDSDSTIVISNSSGGAYGQVVRALSSHWSAAIDASARRSTYQNYDLRVTAGPSVEYNVFDYAESARRQLRLSAALEGESAAYVDTTLYGRTSELNLRQNYGAAAVFAQPWGSTDLYLSASHLLTRPDKYNLGLGGSVEFRIRQGLNANVYGNVSLIRDQISLRGGGASDADVLTAQRELATGYDYRLGLGLSYTFGSIFNPVVNARFGA